MDVYPTVLGRGDYTCGDEETEGNGDYKIWFFTSGGLWKLIHGELKGVERSRGRGGGTFQPLKWLISWIGSDRELATSFIGTIYVLLEFQAFIHPYESEGERVCV